MNALASTISRLFQSDPAPVLGISGGIILFFNTTAQQLIPSLTEGQRASSVLPESLLSCDEEYFVSTARLGNRPVSACGTWFSGMLLLRMHTTPPCYTFSMEDLTAVMRLELSHQRMALDQLTQDGADTLRPETRACIAVLNRSYHRLLRICENISLANDIAQGTPVYRPVPTDLPELFREITAVTAKVTSASGVDIRFTCEEEIYPILADGELLRHMLLNVLSNSLRHAKPGDSIQLHLRTKGSRLLLTVDDTGPGFSADQFGVLFSRRAEGGLSLWSGPSPLGLFIVWGAVDMHGGSVTITNRHRSGASVRILLPRKAEQLRQFSSTTERYAAGKLEDIVRIALSDVLPDEAFAPGQF